MTEALPPHNEELSLFLGVQGSRITHIVDAYARQAIAADRAIRAGDAPKQVEVEHRQGCDALGGYGHGVGPCSCGVGDAAPDEVWVPREPTEAMKRAGGHVNSEWLNDNAPIGEMRYAMPMGGVWQAMLAAAPQPTRVDKGVEAAIRLAALEEAARACEKLAEKRFDDHGTREPDTGACYYGGRVQDEYEARDEEDADCAAAIRALSAPLVAGGEQPK